MSDCKIFIIVAMLILVCILCYRRRDTFVSPTPIIDIPTPNPGALYLQSNGAWQQMSQPRNYLAIGAFMMQTTAPGVPFLFDTIMLKIGSAITADNTTTSTIFSLAPGFTYKCTAEIGLGRGIMYNWVYNDTPFGLIGVADSSSGPIEPAIGYITNSGTAPMQVSVMMNTLTGDSAITLPGVALGAVQLGPFVIIESVS